ncbi:MAG: Gfo/Idh/MocA family protein [Anaerolineae bacterium]
MTPDSIPSRPVNVAMIGAGSMATRVHYPSLASFADVRLVAACDLDERRLAEVADRYGIEGRYGDYRRMIEDTAPDAVYAIGQPQYMYDVWVWCLEHGLNLCIEKPLGLTLHQARILAHLAEKHGCITQVSFQRRASPLLSLLRQECLRRGPMTHAVCQFYKCQPQPLTMARDHMMDDGVHAIDTLRWACAANGSSLMAADSSVPGEVTRIESLTRRVLVPDVNFFAVLLEFGNGATGVMLNSWTSGRRIFRVEMHAPGICAEADPEGEGRLYADGDTTGVPYDARSVAGGDDLHVYGGFRAKNRQFIDAVRSGRLPESHFGDALRTMEVAERILAAGLLSGPSPAHA